MRVISKSPKVASEDITKLKLSWRKHNSEEITKAETTFNEYIKKGWLAIGEKSGKKKQIFRFNPNLETITLAPLVIGE